MNQNEITKHFSVGYTVRQAMMMLEFFVSVARWHELGLWLNQDAIWKKRKKNGKTMRSLMELVYCL